MADISECSFVCIQINLIEPPSWVQISKEYFNLREASRANFEYIQKGLLCRHDKVVHTFKSMDEIRKCDVSNESYWAVLSCGAVYYAVQGGSNFSLCE